MDFSVILLAAALDRSPWFGRHYRIPTLAVSGRVRRLAETGLRFLPEVWLLRPPSRPFRSVMNV